MKPSLRLHPSVPAIVFVIWWVVATLVFPDRMLNADGDMLRHIRHGEEMLRQGSLITSDPFSFTRGGEPFVAFEYGSQLLLALVHRAAGLAGVAIFAGLLIATTYAVLTRFLLARGVDALLAYLVSVGAAVLGAVHWSARPHLLTLLLVAVLLHWLEPGPRRRIWPLVPIFALWANLHGGFVFGLVVLGIYFAGCVGEMLLARGGADGVADARAAWRERALYYAKALAAAGAATFLTPHGWRVHQHIITFFGEPFLLDNTHEFMSPDFHEVVGKLLLVVLLGTITLLTLSPRRPELPRLLLILASVSFVLTARRNIPLFGATVLPILALHFDAAWRRLPDWRGIRAVFDRDAKLGRTAPLVALLCLAFGALAFSGGRVGGFPLVPNRLDPAQFPVEVAARARAEGAEGRIFHDFIWGGYLLYAWPEQKVFIDGGTDFYGAELMRTYMDITGLQPGWRDSLARWDISLALLPAGSALASELAREPAWRVRDCDRTAVLLERGGAGVPDTVRLRACAGAAPAARAAR